MQIMTMNCSKGDANFLAQYQKLLFSEKLEKGSPSEKADILRHTISQLQFAKLSGVSSEEVVSKLLTQYQDAYSNIVDSFDEKTGQTIDAEMTSKSSHYCCWSDGPMATIAPFGILLFRIVRGVPDAIAQAIVPIEVGLSDKELSGVDRSGLNNYAEGALNLCSGHKNESQSWTSSLTVDSVLKMPGFQQLIKHVKVSKDKVLPADKRNERLPLKKETPPPNNQVNNPNPSFRTDIKSTSVPVTNQTITGIRSGPSDYRPHDGNFRQPPDERSYNRDMRPPPSDQILNLYDDKGRPQPNNAARNKGNVYMGRDYGRSDMNNENDAQYMNRKPLFGGGGRTNAQPWQNQRSQPMHGQNSDGYMGKRKMAEAPEEDDNDRPNMAGNAFRTAKQQLAMDNQRKYGGGGGQQNRSSGSLNNAAYGTGKKSLGPRRGLNSKFVPPVMNREDMDTDGNQAANTITRAVLKTGGSESSSFNYEGLDEEKLKGIEPKMIELIMNEIMDTGPELTWDDVAGLEFAKKTIKEIVVWPMLRPDIFTGLRGPPKGLLLFGPPGTGKTLIGKCIASQSKSTFFCISASSLTSKWVGEGEKMVRALFAVARAQQPAVVFIDEIDSLLTQRTDGENEASRRIKTEFLVQLDGASTNSDDRLLVIGATNRPQEIDEAARRRFVKRLYIPLPEYNARKTIIVNLLKKQSYRLEEDQLEQICTRTEGFSGADMATLCREAALGPIRDMSFGDIEHITADQVRPIQFCDFTDALDAVRPSVSDKDLDLYLDWNKTFGSGSR